MTRRNRPAVAEAARRLVEDPSPPVDVKSIVRDAGIEIIERPELALRTTGPIEVLLLRREGRVIIAVNKGSKPQRKRFAIAHAIGHFTLHPWRVSYTDARFTNETRENRQANAFAFELLMPEDVVRAEIDRPLDIFSDPEVGRLAKLFRVSVQAMTIRLVDLGLFLQKSNINPIL